MAGESDLRKEVVDLRERVVRLEVKMEEVNKRLDGFAKYMKDLYDYLQKQQSRPVF
jgi:predicted  nucleic acid-binding Zn-ribbon protein